MELRNINVGGQPEGWSQCICLATVGGGQIGSLGNVVKSSLWEYFRTSCSGVMATKIMAQQEKLWLMAAPDLGYYLLGPATVGRLVAPQVEGVTIVAQIYCNRVSVPTSSMGKARAEGNVQARR